MIWDIDFKATIKEFYLKYLVKNVWAEYLNTIGHELVRVNGFFIDKADETPKQKMEPTAMAKVDGDEEEVDETEEELPKLDGAPIEEGAFKPNTNFGKKNATPQSTFLSKLYK